ncbi:TPA: hypothetical protein DCZ31_00795 [Patescibacteria group bacterium]|nr:hypothetical protein [Candidatus Gracilibacteria bacterium]
METASASCPHLFSGSILFVLSFDILADAPKTKKRETRITANTMHDFFMSFPSLFIFVLTSNYAD